jgi:hypothetical protein
MPGLGIAIAFFGYWTFYYGLTQTQGFNYGFLDLGIPGRWAAAQSIPKDGGGGGVPSSAVPNTVPATGGTPPASGAKNFPAVVVPTATPSGAPAGSYGKDQDGNVYVKKNGQWMLYAEAGHSPFPTSLA